MEGEGECTGLEREPGGYRAMAAGQVLKVLSQHQAA